jgi:hypothetical protein
MHPPLYVCGQITPGYCKLMEVSQWVRLGLHVIGSPPPLSLLSSIIVKLLSQADQGPTGVENSPFGWGLQKFLIIEVWGIQKLSPWLGRVVSLKGSCEFISLA